MFLLIFLIIYIKKVFDTNKVCFLCDNTCFIAYYPLNSDTNDFSGNFRHLTNNGAIPTTDRLGQPNSAYYFNGVSNWLNGSTNGLPGSDRTISVWLFDERFASSAVICYGGSGTCGTSHL